MGKVNQSGFTVIEVILFLAITGLLFAVLMVGVGAGINQQRYLDSARAYRALIQDQYAAALSIDNQITNDWGCQTNGVVDQNTPRSNRGTSECVILGKIVQVLPISDGIASVQTSSITGRLKLGISDVQSMTDIDAILAYQPHIADFDKQVTDIDWGSYLTTDEKPRRPSQAVIAILRSPATGLIRVFTSKNSHANSDLADIINATNASTVLSNCVINDTSVLIPRMLVSVDPGIANADGVRLDGGNNEVCQ